MGRKGRKMILMFSKRSIHRRIARALRRWLSQQPPRYTVTVGEPRLPETVGGKGR
jgi:hypothetical protein